MLADGSQPPQLPDYTLLRLVGRGSYGEVWLARGVTGVYRAIKVIWRHRFEDGDPFEREFRGVRLFAGLSIREPRLLAVFHVGRNDDAGFFYYVMEPADDVVTGAEVDPENYVPRTLRAQGAGVAWSVADTIRLGIDLAEALSVLHVAGLVHRDIKPSNVIHVAGVPKLADIGLIAELGAQTFVGTEGYVAPEGPGSTASDVFSLGKLLYELATGLDRREYPRLPADLSKREDGERLVELMAVLNRACDRDPARRHADAAGLLAELQLLLAGKSVRRLRTAERSIRNTVRVAMLSLVIAAFGLGGAFLERRRAAAADVQRRWAVYAGILSRAERATEAGDFAGARALLRLPAATEPPAAPGLEWQLTTRPVHARAPKRTLGIHAPARMLRWAGEGPRLAILGRDQRLDVVSDPREGAERRTLPGVLQVVAHAASTGPLWVLRTNGVLGRWHPESERFEPVLETAWGVAAASRDGGVLCLTNSYSHCRLQVWRMPAGAGAAPTQASFEIPPDPKIPDVWGTAMSAGGEVLAFGRFSEGRPGNRFEVWRVAEQRRVFDLETEGDVWALDISADGARVAAGFESGEVVIVDVGGARVESRVRCGTGRPRLLAFAPGGHRLMVVGEGGVLVTLEPGTAEPPRLVASVDGLRYAEWLPGGEEIVSADSAGRLVAWGLGGEPDHREWQSAAGFALKSFAASADGQYLAVTATPDAIDVVEARSGRVERRVQGGFRPIGFAADHTLVACDADSRVRTWDPKSGESRWVSDAPSPAVQTAQTAHAGDGRHVGLGTVTGEVLIWDVSERRLVLREKPHAESVTAMCGGVVGPGIAGGSADGSYWIWRPGDSGIRVFAWTNAPVTALALSPDGRRLAVVQAGVGLRVVDSKTGAPRSPVLALADRRVFCALWTTDGGRLLLGGSGGVLEFRETERWTEVATIHLPGTAEAANPRPMQMWMSLGGDRFASFLADGRLLWWDHLNGASP